MVSLEWGNVRTTDRKGDDMNKTILSPLLLLVLIAGFVSAEEDQKVVALFDGKTFVGWEGNLEVFRIEKGAIVGGSLEQPVERNEFLCTKRAYDDFELRLKFKLIGKGANAGVQIRSRPIPDPSLSPRPPCP